MAYSRTPLGDIVKKINDSTGVCEELASTNGDSLSDVFMSPMQVVVAQQGRAPNRWALFGDSRLATSEPASTSLRSLWNCAQVIGGQRCDLVVNAAVSGNDTTQMLARIQTDLLDYTPSHVVFLGGTNDIATGDGANVWIANVCGADGIFDQILATGATILACLEYPASTVYNTATKREDLHRGNRAIEDYARSHANVLLVNIYAPIADAASATGDQLSGTSYDGIHLAATGAIPAGRVLADVIATVQPPRNLLATSLTDVVSATYPNGNIVANGAMSGGAGSVSGVGMTSGGGVGVATSWTVALESGTATCTATKVARTDGRAGERQRLTIASGADNSIVKLRQDLTLPAQVVAGDTVECFWEMDTSSIVGQVDSVACHIQWRTAASASISNEQHPPTLTYLGVTEVVPAFGGVFRTGQLVVPDTATKASIGVRCTIDNGASIVIDVGTFELRKVV